MRNSHGFFSCPKAERMNCPHELISTPYLVGCIKKSYIPEKSIAITRRSTILFFSEPGEVSYYSNSHYWNVFKPCDAFLGGNIVGLIIMRHGYNADKVTTKHFGNVGPILSMTSWRFAYLGCLRFRKMNRLDQVDKE